MTSRALLFLCIIFLCLCRQAPPIDFFKEDVTIEILDGKARVTGIYYFENLTQIGKRIKFYYPFPVDSNHYFPETISLDHEFEKDSAGLYFSLSLRSNSIDSFKIAYEQRVRDRFFRYITTTTKVWRRPIKAARFTVIAPETLSITMSYTFPEPKVVDGYRRYKVQITDFFPGEDLLITW
jgi:hypothetical protein